MAINVVRRRPRSRSVPAPGATSLAIGEIDQTIFSCPACARPLAIGAKKCPGCGTRLVMGVQLRRASVFTAAGLFLGILIGAGGLFAAISIDRLGQPGGPTGNAAAAGATASQPARSTSPSASPAATPEATIVSVPALSRSALGQTIALNERLRRSGATLSAAIKAKRFDALAVSKVLRSMSSDAVVGIGLTTHIDDWPGGMAVAADLSVYYSTMKATAANGLSASIKNERAYKLAATRMVNLVTRLDAIDADVLAAADAAGITLPVESAAP
jgi:hypothetical protein